MVVLGLSTPITIQKLQIRLHSNLDGSSLAHAIQVPMGPLRNLEVLLSSDGSHTRPAAAGLFKAPTNEMKVKMKGKWK